MEKPQNLIDAENNLRLARLKYKCAKSERAKRDSDEDVQFWLNKVTMLTIMFGKGMISGEAK